MKLIGWELCFCFCYDDQTLKDELPINVGFYKKLQLNSTQFDSLKNLNKIKLL